MFTAMNWARLHIRVKTMEMPMFTSWKLKKSHGKIESEAKNMDKLTELKRLQLISESLKCELNMPNNHKDIKKMYDLIYKMAIASENSDDIKVLITTKTALDFLVNGVLK